MKKVLSYLFPSLMALGTALIICITKSVFTMTDTADVFHVLSDAFFVPAVFALGIAGLAFASSNGVFYILGYAIKTLFSVHNWSSKHRFSERQSYADYVEEKREKVSAFPFALLWVGLACLALAFLFLTLFNQYYVG